MIYAQLSPWQAEKLAVLATMQGMLLCSCVDRGNDIEYSPKDAAAAEANVYTPSEQTITGDGNRVPLRRVLLTEKGRQYIEETFSRIDPPDDVSIEAEGDRLWRIHYDTNMLALIRQDAWLSKQENAWELRACLAPGAGPLLSNDPPLKADRQHIEAALESVNEESVILKKLGPSAPEESEEQGGFERVLAKNGVKPFARVWTEHRFFTVDLPPSDAAWKKGPLKATIHMELMRFDTQYAEPAVVSSLLAESENSLPEDALTVAFITFLCPSEGAKAGPQIDSFLAKHCLSVDGGGARKRSSLITEYLRTCRPSHLRMLRQAGVSLDETDKQE